MEQAKYGLHLAVDNDLKTRIMSQVQIQIVTLQIGSACSSYDHDRMTSLQRLAALHKQNEVSWHCEVSNKSHRTLQASTSKQLHHKSVTLISAGRHIVKQITAHRPSQVLHTELQCTWNKKSSRMLSASILEWNTTVLQLYLQYHICKGMYDITFCIVSWISKSVLTPWSY
jgi:hypothetical protein